MEICVLLKLPPLLDEYSNRRWRLALAVLRRQEDEDTRKCKELRDNAVDSACLSW
jgi:hypothetical protein